MNKIIAITIGDIKGIGIRILIDLYNKKKIKNFILFTNKKIFLDYIKKNKINLNIVQLYKSDLEEKIILNNFNIFNVEAKNNNQNTYNSLIESYNYTKKNNFKGIINLPLNKEKIKKIDKKFIGQTEFYQQIDKKKYTNMIFIYKKIIISTLTTHVPIKDILKNISKKNFVKQKILILNDTLTSKLLIKKPKILMAGINPHASENNTIGNEDDKYLKPAVKYLNKKNINIEGPKPADSLLNNQNLSKYNCFVFCYHDQALVAYKYISQNRGVNFTGGLSVIRVSPDHGTAYNLVNKKNYEDKSLLSCFKLINSLKT